MPPGQRQQTRCIPSRVRLSIVVLLIFIALLLRLIVVVFVPFLFGPLLLSPLIFFPLPLPLLQLAAPQVLLVKDFEPLRSTDGKDFAPAVPLKRVRGFQSAVDLLLVRIVFILTKLVRLFWSWGTECGTYPPVATLLGEALQAKLAWICYDKVILDTNRAFGFDYLGYARLTVFVRYEGLLAIQRDEEAVVFCDWSA